METASSSVLVSPAERAAASRVGNVLGGKFRLARLLGVGATASVYLAVHTNGFRAAIKLLHPHLSWDRETLRRFFREARLANLVDHPGVVRVIDDDAGAGGAPFLVMELVDGEPLNELLAREGPLPPARAIDIGVALLDVLAAAHAKGIVHRDIKPGNVFLGRDGRVRVGDFGVARIREADAPEGVTREGLVLGTPAFMPPEQALGQHGRVDATTDVWAVGATLFRLLTGRSVREEARNANEALVLATWKPAPKVASVRADVPASLASVVDRALLLQQASRWPSAVAMKTALERAGRTDATEVFVDASPTLEMSSPLTGSLDPEPSSFDVASGGGSALPLFTGPTRAVEPREPGLRGRARVVVGASFGAGVVALTAALVALGREEPAGVARATSAKVASETASVTVLGAPTAPSVPIGASRVGAADLPLPEPSLSAPSRGGSEPSAPFTRTKLRSGPPPHPRSPRANAGNPVVDPLQGGRF